MSISSDVNVIFAYLDENEALHTRVVVFITPYKRKAAYMLLDQVKTSFIYTYSKNIKLACLLIEKSVLDYIEFLKTTDNKPTSFQISFELNQKINQIIESMKTNKYFKPDKTRRFINKLLSKHSLISLCEEKEAFAEFREKYLKNSEDEADVQLNYFLHKFKDFKVINFDDITQFHNWLEKIEKTELKIFKNKKDTEDIKIAAEYLSYNSEKEKIDFVTGDREFYDSLKIVSEHFKQPVGKLYLIKK